MAEKKKAAKVEEKQLLADKKGKSSPAGNESIIDEISDDMDRFETWVIENGKYILAVCIVAVIGIAIFFSVRYSMEKAKKASIERLANAETIADLEKVLNTTSSDVGRDVTLMRLAQLYVEKKDYASAVKSLDAVVKGMREPYLAYRALLNIGYIHELTGKPDAAIAAFVGVADAVGAPVDFRAEGAYGAGRLYYAGKDMASAGKYFSRFDPAKTSSQQAKQWASLSRAALNRLPKQKPSAVPAAVPAKTAPSKK